MKQLSYLLSPDEFLNASEDIPVIDVRTPAEFTKGHIPGAINMPLFSDEERSVVGKLYKNEGRDVAVLKGLEFVGPKIKNFASEARHVAKNSSVLVHCWRGGMRSESMAWLFRTAGLKVSVLEGGYKAYRALYRHQVQSTDWKFVVLGGPTGSGKTDVLKALTDLDEQVLDLEGLANHKGSAFGALGQLPQPSSEQFENNIHQMFRQFDPFRVVWVEGESHTIGHVYVPDILFDKLMHAPLVMFELDRNRRLDRLVREYGCFSKDLLARSVQKIQKRLGGLKTKEALTALEDGDYRTVADITLGYYDKGYAKSLGQRNKPVLSILTENDNPKEVAAKLKTDPIIKTAVEKDFRLMHG
jgi:tRNA 2-selenouridine synthase